MLAAIAIPTLEFVQIAVSLLTASLALQPVLGSTENAATYLVLPVGLVSLKLPKIIGRCFSLCLL
jgi:hypothetical protein